MKIILWMLLVILLCLFICPKPVKSQVIIPETIPESIRVFAERRILEEFGKGEWKYFDSIIAKESINWKVTAAHYPSGYTSNGVKSSAYGLGGFLNSTWASVGCKKTADTFMQIECAIKYIQQRYGTPYQAKLFHDRNNFY